MDGLAALMAVFGGFILFGWLILIALLVLIIVSNIFLFRKMGLPGWYGIIPFWNTYNQFQKTWLVMPWFWVYLLLTVLGFIVTDGFIGIILSILSLVLGIAANWKLSVAFGRGVGYCIGLCLVPIVFLPMLAFGSAQYIGNQTAPGQMF